MSEDSTPVHRFHARTYVCGVLGQAPGVVIDTLLAASPPVEEVPAEGFDGRIWWTRRPGQVQKPPYTVIFDGGQVTRRQWRTIADEERAGLFVNSDHVRLFAGALGFQSLYYRNLDGAIIFASTPNPLVAIAEVSTDWTAWADILAFGYPLGSSTQFSEIKRLQGGGSIVVDQTGYRYEAYKPYWWELGAPTYEAGALVAAVESTISPFHLTRTAVTLSGGWDSRLLSSILIRKASSPPAAFTIAKDDGYDLDIELSRPVAEALGMPQTIMSQPHDMASQERSFRQRVFYETWMHAWLEPLAQRLRRAQRVVVDGIGGDVLIKALHVPYEVADTDDGLAKVDLVHSSLTREAQMTEDGPWGAGIGPSLAEISRERLREITTAIHDHPALPSLTVLLNRTARGITLSPFWMFGPECGVLTPFTNQEVVRLALAVPLEKKLGGAYYRQVLEASAGELALLPSTNDTRGRNPRPRKQLEAANLAYHTKAISRSPDAAKLLAPDLRALLDDPSTLATHPGLPRWHRLVKVTSLLAEWQSAYASRLVDVGEAPW